MTDQPDIHASFAEALKGAWRLTARPEQLAPAGTWTTWIFCGGRGAGKTRSGAEWIQERVESGAGRYIHLVAPTAGDARDVLLEGPAGILTIAPPHMRPVYQPSLRKVTWPNGAQALLFSSDEPDRLRGPQADTLWIDELCAMRTAQDVLDMAYMGLRLGKDPRALITTTPRPIKPFKALLSREGQDVVVTRSSSYANRDNLAPQFLQQILAKYAGTRLGRQEIDAELLTDVPGALWHLERIEELRVPRAPERLERVVVAVDPAVTFGPDSDETGLIVAGLGADGACYVLDDASGRYPPEEWARRAIQLYRRYCADRIVAETNQGGDLVEKTLRSVDPSIPYRGVHASRGKVTRAEPVSALYEQGRVHHVGVFGPLEDQLTSYDGSRGSSSPDRLDALCWAVHELMLNAPVGKLFREDHFLVAGKPASLTKPPTLVFCVIGTPPDATADGAAVAAVYLAKCRLPDAPLVVVDWEIAAPDGALLSGLWVENVARRLGAWAAALQAANYGIWAERTSPAGSALFELAVAHRLLVADMTDSMRALPSTLQDRAALAARFVGGGAVKISPDAFDRVETFNGVTRNHFMAQICAFGGETPTPSECVAALCAGVLAALNDDAAVERMIAESSRQSPHELHGPFGSAAAANLPPQQHIPSRAEQLAAQVAAYERELARWQADYQVELERQRRIGRNPTWVPPDGFLRGFRPKPQDPRSLVAII